MDFVHTPVLLEEVIEGLNIRRNGIYIDGTIGGGGHSEEIIKHGARVLGIEKDKDAILHLKKKFESEISQGVLILVRGSYSEMDKIALENKISEVDGILLDLGLSSYQLDHASRGFSFRYDEPLDMRMSNETSLTAEAIVNIYSYEELYEIFAKYGEEPNARKFAGLIIDARKNKPIKTTKDLVEAILGKDFKQNSDIHPATRVFQALRIVVNDEIEDLKIGLDSGFKLLKGRGRFAIISFHSLEDRVVKLKFLELSRKDRAKLVTKKPIVASSEELARNKRSRSAKLRILEKNIHP